MSDFSTSLIFTLQNIMRGTLYTVVEFVSNLFTMQFMRYCPGILKISREATDT
jgi:hypothetical protein